MVDSQAVTTAGKNLVEGEIVFRVDLLVNSGPLDHDH